MSLSTIAKEYLLNLLIAYRDNMSEFDEEDMDYLIELVRKDLNHPKESE